MARVRVVHGLDGLVRDLASGATRVPREGPRVVAKNVAAGHAAAQRFARAASGPHGTLYYKRITAEMTGPLSGEYGPTGDVRGRAVGAGWRSGPPNTDLEKSLDVVGPRFAEDARDLLADCFWPA